MGSFIRTTHLLIHHISCSVFAKHQIPQVTQPLYSPDLVLCNFWLFPKLKSPLKMKKFQAVNEIQENMMGQLMLIGRIVWGPKVPTLKGTDTLLSYVQCFLYLLSSSINVSIFHITWLDTFLTDLIYVYIYVCVCVCVCIYIYIFLIIGAQQNIVPVLWAEWGNKQFS